MQYKLINLKTKEETICDKVVINGFDYYISNNHIEDGRENFFTYDTLNHKILHISHINYFGNENNGRGSTSNGRASFKTFKGIHSGISHPEVIATSNPNIDIPQIINQVEFLAEEWVFETNKEKWSNNDDTAGDNFGSYKAGYQKSQETHPFSLEDMVEFAKWIANTKLYGFSKQLYEAMLVNEVKTVEELIEIWRNQRLKTIYYE